jgi:hypothetical protein
MNRCTINGACKPPRIGSLATISGALLGTIGAVGPALSADLPFGAPYQPGYYQNWNDCGYYCRQWGSDARFGVPGYEPFPPMAERFPPERHWVPRDYAEPRYPMGGPYPPYTQYRGGPYRSHRYSSYYPGPDAGANPYEAYERAPRDEPRRRFGDGGFPYPPAPAAYEYGPGRRGPFRYEAMAPPPYDYREYRPPYQYRPAYEYETAERPPAPVPGGGYGPGYPE